jgi:hypothetical protein
MIVAAVAMPIAITAEIHAARIDEHSSKAACDSVPAMHAAPPNDSCGPQPTADTIPKATFCPMIGSSPFCMG